MKQVSVQVRCGRCTSSAETLRDVNAQLWDIEDRIRDKERDAQFDAGFIELARAVYVTNDGRAALKRRAALTASMAVLPLRGFEGSNA